MGLDKKTVAMAKEPNYATLTTLFKSGAPQTHVMWVDTDGENILINTEIHRRKYLNVKDDPRVNVMIWKHDNEFKFVEIRGIVVGEITGEDALKNISFSIDEGEMAFITGHSGAGKSTLLSRITAAKPKIADYPFTTLHPNLGVVNQDNKEFVIADIPGLIEGAHEGLGLGHRFLGHVERCKGLLHLIDATSENIKHDYLTIIKEIEAYDSNLSKKQQIIVLTKSDAVKEQKLNFAKEQLKKLNVQKVFGISSVSGENIIKLVRQLQELITSMKKIEDDEDGLEKVSFWSP